MLPNYWQFCTKSKCLKQKNEESVDKQLALFLLVAVSRATFTEIKGHDIFFFFLRQVSWLQSGKLNNRECSSLNGTLPHCQCVTFPICSDRTGLHSVRMVHVVSEEILPPFPYAFVFFFLFLSLPSFSYLPSAVTAWRPSFCVIRGNAHAHTGWERTGGRKKGKGEAQEFNLQSLTVPRTSLPQHSKKSHCFLLGKQKSVGSYFHVAAFAWMFKSDLKFSL